MFVNAILFVPFGSLILYKYKLSTFFSSFRNSFNSFSESSETASNVLNSSSSELALYTYISSDNWFFFIALFISFITLSKLLFSSIPLVSFLTPRISTLSRGCSLWVLLPIVLSLLFVCLILPKILKISSSSVSMSSPFALANFIFFSFSEISLFSAIFKFILFKSGKTSVDAI